MAQAVGRSASWVNRLLKWHRSGYMEYSPFGPHDEGTSCCACETADQGIQAAEAKATATTTSADAETSSSSADSWKPTSAEAKENLMRAISHWWPHLDRAGRVEVTLFLQTEGSAGVGGKRLKPRVECDIGRVDHFRHDSGARKPRAIPLHAAPPAPPAASRAIPPDRNTTPPQLPGSLANSPINKTAALVRVAFSTRTRGGAASRLPRSQIAPTPPTEFAPPIGCRPHQGIKSAISPA
jgi:hypothetical protein